MPSQCPTMAGAAPFQRAHPRDAKAGRQQQQQQQQRQQQRQRQQQQQQQHLPVTPPAGSNPQHFFLIKLKVWVEAYRQAMRIGSWC